MLSKLWFGAFAGCEPSMRWKDKSSDAVKTGRWLQPSWERWSIWWQSSVPSGAWWCSILSTGLSSYLVTVVLLVHFTSHTSSHHFRLPSITLSFLLSWLKLTCFAFLFHNWLLVPSGMLLQNKELDWIFCINGFLSFVFFLMIRTGVSRWMFLMVLAYPGSYRQRAIKRLLLWLFFFN